MKERFAVCFRLAPANHQLAVLFGDAELWVDPAVWDELVARMVTAMKDLHAAALTPRTPGAKHVSATAMLFAIDAGGSEEQQR